MARTLTISLPAPHRLALIAAADAEHDGNLSALVRALIERDAVTKSYLQSPSETTSEVVSAAG